jgi:hypothetical protein
MRKLVFNLNCAGLKIKPPCRAKPRMVEKGERRFGIASSRNTVSFSPDAFSPYK